MLVFVGKSQGKKFAMQGEQETQPYSYDTDTLTTLAAWQASALTAVTPCFPNDVSIFEASFRAATTHTDS